MEASSAVVIVHIYLKQLRTLDVHRQELKRYVIDLDDKVALHAAKIVLREALLL